MSTEAIHFDNQMPGTPEEVDEKRAHPDIDPGMRHPVSPAESENRLSSSLRV